MVERVRILVGELLGWASDHAGLLTALGIATVVVTLAAVPLVVARLPEDYFLRRERRDVSRPFALRLVLRGGRNLVGALLVLVGLALLFLPGQGLLTILIGVTLVEFPGKRALELWMVRGERVRRGIAWLRARTGRPPLRFPEEV